MAGMTLFDYTVLVNYITERYSWHSIVAGHKHIKYIRSSFDTRSNMIYAIELDKTLFAVVNENRKRDLKKWIYSWLEDKDDGFKLERDDPEFAELVKPKKNDKQEPSTTLS